MLAVNWVPLWMDKQKPQEKIVQQGYDYAKQTFMDAKDTITDAAEEAKHRVFDASSKASDKVQQVVQEATAKASDTVPSVLQAGLSFFTMQSASMQLFRCLLFTFGLQLFGGFLPHMLTGFDQHYHMLGAINFIAISLYTFLASPDHNLRQILLTTMVCIWSIRLVSYLYRRDKITSHRKLSATKGRPLAMFTFWAAQALWCIFTVLPIIFVNSNYAPGMGYDTPIGHISKPRVLQPKYGTWDYHILNRMDVIGMLTWAIGLVIESVADYQKAKFRANPAKKQPFIDTGLWKYSRHPNYLGEMLVWLGIYLSAYNVLHGWQHIAVLSPIFVLITLTSVTGIPLLEESAERQFGNIPGYQEYKRKTSILVPFVI